MTTHSTIYTLKQEPQRVGTVQCYSCGAPVKVMLPYYGCVYCLNCSKVFSWSGGQIGNSKL